MDFLLYSDKWSCKLSVWTAADWWKVLAFEWRLGDKLSLLRLSCSGWLTDWRSVRESGVVSTKMLKFEVFHCCVNRKSPSDAGNGTATVFQKCQIPRAYSPSPGRSQNISSFRIQGHCIFNRIHFLSPQMVPGSEAGPAALPQVLAACVIRALTWCLG